jgi:hypothetical protein
MKLYLDSCCYNRPYDDQTQKRIHLVRFIQQYENGYGDYTKEKYQQPDFTVEEVDSILRNK